MCPDLKKNTNIQGTSMPPEQNYVTENIVMSVESTIAYSSSPLLRKRVWSNELPVGSDRNKRDPRAWPLPMEKSRPRGRAGN